MSAINLISIMSYGDAQGLRTFFSTHNNIHQLYAQKIVSPSVAVPLFDVSDQAALDDMVEMMDAVGRKESAEQTVVINNWLKMHYDLHAGEMAALGLGQATDISTVDFRKPQQFYDWLASHQQLHDAEDAALGV